MPAEHDLSRVRAGYDGWAEVYDHDQNPLLALEEPRVREAAGEVTGLEVLDLGCGTGRHTLWLARAGAHVTALDFSPGMLDRAREKAAGLPVEFLTHDLRQALPLDEASQGLVVSGLVLEHLPDLELFFAEIRRVLRPGARAVVSAMHPAMFERASQARYTHPSTGEIVQPGSVNHSLDDISRAVERSDLELEALDEYSPDAEFASLYPRAQKYVDWPMLLILRLRRYQTGA